MNDIKELEIKIYPLILTAEAASSLWHLCRTLDSQGSGKVSLTMKELCEYLNVSPSCVYKYLKSSLFNRVVSHKNKSIGCQVYSLDYKSLKQVKVEFQLENMITTSYCKWADINQFMKKRITATEVIAESIQSRSRYCARNNKDKNQKLLSIDMMFSGEEESPVSDNTQGIKKTEYGIFYHADYYAPYGASQKTIGEVVGCTRQTVNKRLKNKPKVQQFVQRDYYAADYAEQCYLDAENWTTNAIAKYICKFGQVYQRYTNFYLPEYQLGRKIIDYSPLPLE